MTALSLNRRGMAGRAPLAERRDDLYETPAEATHALLRAEDSLPRRIWDPACGRGAIVQVLRAAGHEVIATDLVDYGETVAASQYRLDFLMEIQAPDGVEAIVANPPFKLAEAFAEHALDLCPLVIMFLRLSFLESERRRRILEERGLARVHVFRNRLPMMHRDGWDGPRASSSIPFAWFVWIRGYTGPATLHRISWQAVPR